jgi:hypothetical protein
MAFKKSPALRAARNDALSRPCRTTLPCLAGEGKASSKVGWENKRQALRLKRFPPFLEQINKLKPNKPWFAMAMDFSVLHKI